SSFSDCESGHVSERRYAHPGKPPSREWRQSDQLSPELALPHRCAASLRLAEVPGYFCPVFDHLKAVLDRMIENRFPASQRRAAHRRGRAITKSIRQPDHRRPATFTSSLPHRSRCRKCCRNCPRPRRDKGQTANNETCPAPP